MEVEVVPDEILVGEEEEHSQPVWNPTIILEEGGGIPLLSDYKTRVKKIKERVASFQDVMESLIGR